MSELSFDRPPFVNRGYYVPPVLANGTDFCQLDFSGTMAFKDHIKGYFSYWYKKGRPHAADPFGIVKLDYTYTSEKGPVEIGDFRQRFVPETGRLNTWVSMYGLEMDVETFLTDDHTLIEIFRILDSGPEGGTLDFDQIFWTVTYSFKQPQVLSKIPGAVSVGQEQERPVFFYRYAQDGTAFEGMGVSTVRVLEGSPIVQAPVIQPSDFEPWTRVPVTGLHKGAVLARLTTVLDSMDSPTWREDMWAAHARHVERTVLARGLGLDPAWQRVADASDFRCTTPETAAQVRTSAAVCKMALKDNGSVVSALAHPNNHGMGTYWDVGFLHAGMLRTNRVKEAAKVIDFWRQVYPDARRLARERYDLNGARFAWVLRGDGLPFYDAPQVHNNAIPAITIWDQYLYTGDLGILADTFELMEDTARFLIEYGVRRDEDGAWYLRDMISVDESAQLKRNELLTAIVTRRNIEIVEDAAALLGRLAGTDIGAARPALDRILADLRKDGVYQAYAGGDVGTWATALAYLHYPDAAAFPRAIDFALAGCEEAHGLGIGRTSRMRCATFPWVEGIFAWSMVRNGDARAFRYLEGMNRYTNFFGGFAETHWLHGEPSRDWFVAAHGVYLAALAELCVQRDGDTLRVFPLGLACLPWKHVAFRDFRLPGGLLVSCDYTAGQTAAIEVANDTDAEQVVTVNCGDRTAQALRIAPMGRWRGPG